MPREFDNALLGDVRKKAHELKRNAVFARCDPADIEQQLWMRLLEKQESFPSLLENGMAFFRKVLRNLGRDLIDRMDTVKERFEREVASLEDVADEDEEGAPVALENTLVDPRPGPLGEIISSEARASFFARLSGEQSEIVARLEYGSQGKVAAEMGLPRNTFRDRHIRPIQKHWRTAHKDS